MASYTIEIVVQGKNEATGVLQNVEGGIRRVADTAERATGGVGGFFKNAFAFAAGGAITAGISAITGSIGTLASGMIGGNAEFEKYQTQFGVLLGNADAAKERLGELADFGASTPFELPELVRADKVLTSFGIHSQDMLTVVGDVAAGTGVSFEEMALNMGKFSAGATGEALSRFQELGVATKQELAAMGIEFDKAGSMTTPVAEAMPILENLMKEKFGGMMEAQSKTFDGMVSNLQDWAGSALRTLGQPIFEVVKDKLGALLEWLNSPEVQEGIKKFAEALANGIGVAVDWLANTAIPWLSNAWTNTLKPALEIVWAFIQVKVLPTLLEIKVWLQENLPPAIQALSDFWTTKLKPALEQVWFFIQNNVIPILRDVLVWLRDNIPPAIQALSDFWTNTLKPALETVWQFISENVIPILSEVLTWLRDNIPPAIQTLSDFWTNTLNPALEAVWQFISEKVIPIFVSLVQEHFEQVKGAVQSTSDFWNNKLKPALEAVWNFLNTYVIPVLKALANVFTAIVQRAVEELVKIWNEKFRPALDAVWTFLEGYLVPSLKALKDKALSSLTDMVKTAANAFNNTFKPALDTISSFIMGTAKPAIDGISGAIGAIGDAVQGAIRWLNKLADAIRGVPSMPGGGGGGGGSVPGFASGTRFAPGGLAWVGEEGPELVDLPRGSRVYPAAESRRMASGDTYNITYYGTGSQDERSVRDDIRYLQMLRG